MLHFWTDCSRLLERELTPQQFSAWIKPLKAIDYDAATGRLRIGAPNRLKLDTIRMQFAARIQQAAADVLKRPVSVEFEVEAIEQMPPAAATNGEGVTSPLTATTTPTRTVTNEIERARLNSVLTFDTFVNGKANQLARAPRYRCRKTRAARTTRCFSTVAWAWARRTSFMPSATAFWRANPTPRCAISTPSST